MTIKEAKRIAIFGCAGSGKSTLAFKLHHKLNLPLYHLDQFYWKPNWQMPDFNEFRKTHDELCERENWIIEGMYTRALMHRLDRADIIIYLDMPRWLCMYQTLKRLVWHYGRLTPSSAQECPERFDVAFLKWIWNYRKRFHPTIMSMIDMCDQDKKVYTLTSRKDIKKFLEKI
jgi:adenylate kinase family enzyme